MVHSSRPTPAAWKASAKKMWGLMSEHPDRKDAFAREGRTGVRFGVHQDGERFLFGTGTMLGERAQECNAFATEKLDRLGRNRSHWSSSESRLEPNQYNGAVRLQSGDGTEGDDMCAASGLKQDDDEVLALATAVDVGRLTAPRAVWIAQVRSKNPNLDMLHYLLANR